MLIKQDAELIQVIIIVTLVTLLAKDVTVHSLILNPQPQIVKKIIVIIEMIISHSKTIIELASMLQTKQDGKNFWD